MKALILALLTLSLTGGCMAAKLPSQAIKTVSTAIETTGKVVETTGKVIIAGSQTVGKVASFGETALKTPGVGEAVVAAVKP